MITLPVFPPCTPGNFVPELRTLAPVNQKVNSHCHCDEDGDDNDYAKGTVGDNLIFLFHQRLKVLKMFSFFIGPESDHWLCLSLTDSLTDSLTPV